jgi:hypothetical protein
VQLIQRRHMVDKSVSEKHPQDRGQNYNLVVVASVVFCCRLGQ